MRRPWTQIELALLDELYPDFYASEVGALLERSQSAIFAQAFLRGLAKSPEFLVAEKEARRQHSLSDMRMAAGRFKKGLTPWNAGMKGYCPPGSERGWFKKGHALLSDRSRPIGSYRVVAGTGKHAGHSQLEKKLFDTPGPNNRRWVPVPRLVWEAAHGPVPEGYIVVFKHPSLRTVVLEEITLDKLDCITRAEHAHRNHPRSTSPELGRLVLLKGAITRQVNRIHREAAQKSNPTTPKE